VNSQFTANQVQKVGGVTAIEYSETFGQTDRAVMAAKRVVGDRVKGPARNAANVVATSNRANSAHYLARRAPGERQEQNSFRRDATLEKDFDSGRQCGRLSGSRSRDDSKRPVPKCGRRTLPFIELSLRREHVIDANQGV
jgi:hypothetical protein